jgi:RNA-directed DNA polymerase
MHHIYQVERLEAAYMACKRDAAAGVDGQTWLSYGQDLRARLEELSDRLARGGYDPQPVKGRRIFPIRGRSDFPTRLRRVVVV